jgi:hypothetical protein
MNLGAAQAKLSGLVKGTLIGVRVTKRDGASPRVVRAVVVGTGGQTPVSGIDLERRFGLLSTLARFKTVTTKAGTIVGAVKLPAVGHSPDVSRITAETATGLSALVGEFFAPSAPGVSGRVFPAANGALLTLQKRSGSHWRTVGRALTNAGGGYTVRVPGAGTYRVSSGGLPGPPVYVG